MYNAVKNKGNSVILKLKYSVYPLEIIKKYYSPDSKAFYFLICHGKMVAEKALTIARMVRRFGPDLKFIGEAAMLHDIGILITNESSLGCYGDNPYICHGYAGREILEKEGLPVHALVCERHVGRRHFSRGYTREKSSSSRKRYDAGFD